MACLWITAPSLDLSVKRRSSNRKDLSYQLCFKFTANAEISSGRETVAEYGTFGSIGVLSFFGFFWWTHLSWLTSHIALSLQTNKANSSIYQYISWSYNFPLPSQGEAAVPYLKYFSVTVGKYLLFVGIHTGI